MFPRLPIGQVQVRVTFQSFTNSACQLLPAARCFACRSRPRRFLFVWTPAIYLLPSLEILEASQCCSATAGSEMIDRSIWFSGTASAFGPPAQHHLQANHSTSMTLASISKSFLPSRSSGFRRKHYGRHQESLGNMLTKMQCHGLHRLTSSPDFVDMKQGWRHGE